MIWVLIFPVPAHCIVVTFIIVVHVSAAVAAAVDGFVRLVLWFHKYVT